MLIAKIEFNNYVKNFNYKFNNISKNKYDDEKFSNIKSYII